MADRRTTTLLDRCDRAATAAEARFRIDAPNSTGRSSRIIALDSGAERIVESLARGSWNGARFLVADRRLGHGRSSGLTTDVGKLPLDYRCSQ